MEDNRKVSIITPVYNAAKYITSTLDSVRSQTYQDWEHILIDDCSKDDSVKIIRDYIDKAKDDRIKLVVNESNLGAAKTRNKALSMCEGRYISYIDADDSWHENKLERELDFMSEKRAGFVFCDYEFADENLNPTGAVAHVPQELDYKGALKNTTIFTSTVIFDTKMIPKEKLEMPVIKSEDTALWWKLLREGIKAYGLGETLVTYRRPEKSLSSNKIEALRRIWNLYKNEGLHFYKRVWYFCFWAVNAVKRRV